MTGELGGCWATTSLFQCSAAAGRHTKRGPTDTLPEWRSTFDVRACSPYKSSSTQRLGHPSNSWGGGALWQCDWLRAVATTIEVGRR